MADSQDAWLLPAGLPIKEKNSKLGNKKIYPVFLFLQMTIPVWPQRSIFFNNERHEMTRKKNHVRDGDC